MLNPQWDISCQRIRCQADKNKFSKGNYQLVTIRTFTPHENNEWHHQYYREQLIRLIFWNHFIYIMKLLNHNEYIDEIGIFNFFFNDANLDGDMNLFHSWSQVEYPK